MPRVLRLPLCLSACALLAAACTTVPADAPPEPVATQQVAPPSTPPPPPPPPPPAAAHFLTGPEPVLQSTGDPKVDEFRARVLREAGRGWEPYFKRLFAGVRENPAIVAEFDALAAIDEPAEYIAHYVTPERIAAGREALRHIPPVAAGENRRREVEAALWGALADYGARPPRYDVFEALLTLGAYGRGPHFTDFELFKAAEMVVTGRVPRARALAYATGRIGQPQMTVDQYLRLGRDGDGDGVVDIWTNRADILANLQRDMREPELPLVVAVRPDSFDRSDPMDARRAQALESPGNTPATIFTRWDGQPWEQRFGRMSGTYLEPWGKDGPAYLLSNWSVPVIYADPSRHVYASTDEQPGFGLAVALLAEAIAGRPVPTGG